MTFRSSVAAAALLIGLATGTGYAVAGSHEKSEGSGPVHDRHELMEDVGDAAKLMGGMIKGEVEYDGAKAREAMEFLAGVPADFVTMFPEDTMGDPDSEAKDTIWQDWDGFKKAAEALEMKASAAVETVDDGPDALKAAFGDVVKTCKNCHEKFRLEKE